MRKKILRFVLIAVMTGAMLTGCANNEQSSRQPDKSDAIESSSDESSTIESIEAESSEAENSTTEQVTGVEDTQPAEKDVLTTDIDLEEARLWIYDSPELYEADGNVKWNEGLTRYIEEDVPCDKLSDSLAKTIEQYKVHGYSYVGDETDITSLNEDSFKNNDVAYFKLELTDPVLLAELETAMLNAYIDAGKSMPEDEKYDALIERIQNTIKEFTTLGIQVTWISFKETYSVWTYGEFRFNDKEFVRFTENFEWIPRWLEYNTEDKMWQLSPDY
ncbi:MAG: hypothetical protein IJ282_04190 [Lachnospiraceae bacterium]|nr:hypothetical protein [Lachnospiraceae bacterium]